MILQCRCLGFAVLILGVSAACTQAGDGTEAAKVMGDVTVAAGEHSGDVSTVNGSIHVRDNAVVANAHTVNGPIRLEQGARVRGDVNTVNGGLTLAAGAEVGGQLGNVNGPIHVAAAHVSGSVETVSGGMELGPDAHVDGGLHVHKNDGLLNWGSVSVPRIVVGPGSRVGGTLNFERKVALYVSDTATIGPVRGAHIVKYSGDRPPD